MTEPFSPSEMVKILDEINTKNGPLQRRYMNMKQYRFTLLERLGEGKISVYVYLFATGNMYFILVFWSRFYPSYYGIFVGYI